MVQDDNSNDVHDDNNGNDNDKTRDANNNADNVRHDSNSNKISSTDTEAWNNNTTDTCKNSRHQRQTNTKWSKSTTNSRWRLIWIQSLFHLDGNYDYDIVPINNENEYDN